MNGGERDTTNLSIPSGGNDVTSVIKKQRKEVHLGIYITKI